MLPLKALLLPFMPSPSPTAPPQAALSRVSDGQLRSSGPYAAATNALMHADQRARQVNEETRVRHVRWWGDEWQEGLL